MKCDRCGKDTVCWKTSWFNLDNICPECQEIEEKHPRFKEAHDKVIEEENKGNKDFEGIGWPGVE